MSSNSSCKSLKAKLDEMWPIMMRHPLANDQVKECLGLGWNGHIPDYMSVHPASFGWSLLRKSLWGLTFRMIYFL